MSFIHQDPYISKRIRESSHISKLDLPKFALLHSFMYFSRARQTAVSCDNPCVGYPTTPCLQYWVCSACFGVSEHKETVLMHSRTSAHFKARIHACHQMKHVFSWDKMCAYMYENVCMYARVMQYLNPMTPFSLWGIRAQAHESGKKMLYVNFLRSLHSILKVCMITKQKSVQVCTQTRPCAHKVHHSCSLHSVVVLIFSCL